MATMPNSTYKMLEVFVKHMGNSPERQQLLWRVLELAYSCGKCDRGQEDMERWLAKFRKREQERGTDSTI